MIFRRRKQQQERITAQLDQADQHLQQARSNAADAASIAADLRATRLRNHFGESVLAAFQTRPPRRKGWPWTH